MASDPPQVPRATRVVSGVAVALVLAATFVVGACAVNTLSRIGETFPGFFVWENLFVPAVGAPSWTGATHGVRYQSWVLVVDEAPVTRAGDISRIGERHSAGDLVRYELLKGGQRYATTVPMMVLDFGAWAPVLGIYLFNAGVLLVLGIVVLYMNPGDAAARAMFLFSTNLALYMATSADLFGPYWFRPAYFFFVNLIPASVWHLLSRFPAERVRKPVEDRIAALLAAVGLVLASASNVVFHESRATVVALDRVTHVLMAAAGLGAIGFFSRHFLSAPSALVRERTRVVLLGTLGAFTAPVVALALTYGFGVPVALNLVTLTFVLFPLSIGYAIVRLDLFDIDRVIRRTLTYIVLSGLVFGAYSLIIGTVDYYFENLTQWGSRAAEGLLILGLIVITSPSRDRIQDLVDRVYDRRRYSYRDVVRSTSRTFATILDFEKLVVEALGLIDDTLQPTAAAIYAQKGEHVAVAHGRLVHEPAEARRVHADLEGENDPRLRPLVQALRIHGLVVVGRQDGGSARGAERSDGRNGAAAALAEAGAEFAVAMELEGRLAGFLVVGPKRSGARYTSDDHELARTICDQLAVALENARAYKTIGLLAADLERNNLALEQTNVELRDAQDELVQKERLAALGELSGAVAHAIRNPLAGIKAAAQLAYLDLDGHPAAQGVRDVISESDRLDQRIGALLQYARPFEPVFQHAALPPIVEHAVRDTAAKAAARHITVTCEIDAGLPEPRLDPILIEQALVELLSNAIDASAEASSVRIRASADRADAVFFEVVDSGGGINERAAERLFELFYTTKPRGTGFGLATVKKIVERHAGRISVSNHPGSGAAFRIELPLEPPAAQRKPNFSRR